MYLFGYFLLTCIVIATFFILFQCLRKILTLWFRGCGSVGGEEYSETSSEAVRDIADFIRTRNLGEATFYDVGCSLGNVVFHLHKLCPSLKIVGIERQRSKFYFSLFENFFQKRNSTRPVFLQQDFYTSDLSQADIVFVYIPRIFLEKFSQKLEKELRPGTYVITYRIDFPSWVPDETLLTDIHKGVSDNSIFVYKKGESGFVH